MHQDASEEQRIMLKLLLPQFPSFAPSQAHPVAKNRSEGVLTFQQGTRCEGRPPYFPGGMINFSDGVKHVFCSLAVSGHHGLCSRSWTQSTNFQPYGCDCQSPGGMDRGVEVVARKP